MLGTPSSTPDPLRLPSASKAFSLGYQVPSGKILNSPVVASGEKVFCAIVAGDSMGGNYHQTAYAATHPTKVENFSVYDGSLYRAVKPLIGAGKFDAPSDGNWQIECGDRLIDSTKYDRTIWATVSIGGTLVSEWEGDLNASIVVAARRLIALGITPTCIIMQVGANDRTITKADYKASAKSIVSKVRAAGVSLPWFWPKSTWVLTGALPNIRTAIDELVAEDSAIKLGPDLDGITGRFDSVHYNSTGASDAATLYATTIGSSF